MQLKTAERYVLKNKQRGGVEDGRTIQKEVLLFLPPQRPIVTNKKIENSNTAESSSTPAGLSVEVIGAHLSLLVH